MEALVQKLNDHIEADNVHFKQIDKTLSAMEKCLETIRDNHLHTLEGGFEELKGDIKVIRSDMKWIKGIGAIFVIQTIAFIVDIASRYMTIK